MADETKRLEARRQLSAFLSHAKDEDFLLTIWGVNALQTGNAEGGATAFPFGFPPEVVTNNLTGDLAIYPWELETITNELLASPKGFYQMLSCNKWETVPQVVNLLRRIDDLDFEAKSATVNIFQELFRISGRQFDWQRGYFNQPQFYRSLFIYGQGDCATYFQERYGISINELSVVGFGLFANFVKRPNFTADGDFSMLKLTPAMRDKALAILAAPLAELRSMAAREREKWDTIAYRPSVLRRYPVIRFGPRGWRLRSPLPALILERITSGLFYDVISGGGAIRNDYGRRFEQYALLYLQAMLPGLRSEPESRYKAAGNPIDTPDIICSDESASGVRVAIECKASRMSFGARFADEPAAERGYEDIVKAIFQLWRYFSHCRRGLTGQTLAPDAMGLVLTLDGWMVMAHEMFEDIFARALSMAKERDPLIEEQDRRPIAFSSIADFESALAVGTKETLLAALHAVAEPDRRGGYVSHQHSALVGKDAPRRSYPFQDMESLLPWWGIFKRAGASEGRP